MKRCIVLFAIAILACSRPSPSAQPQAQSQGQGQGQAHPEAGDAHESHGGHADHDAGHERGEPHQAGASDLDRPVDELFAATCEHARKTHECDECRYEVGVVRVPARLLERGLVKKATAARRSVEAPLSVTGEVKFDERRVVHVAPRVEGAIRAVRVGLGERVKRGQPLIEVESVGVGEAESDALAARAALRLAKANHQRQEQLRAERISSEKEYLQSRQELEAAQIRVRAAEEKLARLGMSGADLARARGEGRLVLRAPADGVVLEMHAVGGELVGPEESVVTIGDTSAVWVWADLPEDQLAGVVGHRGRGDLRAEVTVKAFPDETFRGAVDFVAPAMDERTRTVKVRVAVKNPDARLRAGMFASVRIFLPADEQTVAVPRSAVLADEGRSFVFVHHHGEYWVRRPVEPGRTWHEWVEVKSGLTGAETVVADGSFLLKSDVLRSKMGAGCAD
ncbi:MAG TPA: efflux RND transporter periplasmic adaptor subunit [Anaeromyxobacteraceae bacterium]|nr:efflux RND transporter periplasmic adaptor subunit [Anaeromyxobacteraceae bacterium]